MKIKDDQRNSWWNHIPESAKIVKIAVFLEVSPPSSRLLHSKFHSKMSAPRSEFASNIGTMRSTGRFPSRAFGAPCLKLNPSDLIGEYGTTLRGPKLGPLFQSNVIGPS